ERLVRAEGVEPPHLAILEPKSSASTSSATRARPKRGRRITGEPRWATRGRRIRWNRRRPSMQQQPPSPGTPAHPPPETPPPTPGPVPSPPPETPPVGPAIDVPAPPPAPSPPQPGPGPISPTG